MAEKIIVLINRLFKLDMKSENEKTSVLILIFASKNAF